MEEDAFKSAQLPALKLFMILLGSKAPGRNVEQHDYFFGIAGKLKDLVPAMRAFWPEAGQGIHIDGWREVNRIGDYNVKILPKNEAEEESPKKIFFINLGGYQSGKLEEQHYTVLSVHEDRSQAIQDAKKTVFFKTNTLKGAGSHIDEKYGVDVDDIYKIEDILSPEFKDKYQISISSGSDLPEDPVHLGYFRLDKIR